MSKRRFMVEIADQIIGIDSCYNRIYNICKPFIIQKGSPSFCVSMTEDDLYKAEAIYEEEYGHRAPCDNQLEVTAIFNKVADGLIDYKTILIHGASIALNNSGIIFAGRSGVGKTTHILKWLQAIPDSFVINGDKTFIKAGDEPIICSSPWAGKERYFTNVKVPLKAVVFLERNDVNNIRKISFSESFIPFYQQIHRPEELLKMQKTISILKSLDQKVSFYHFEINNFKEDCFTIAYNTICSGFN